MDKNTVSLNPVRVGNRKAYDAARERLYRIKNSDRIKINRRKHYLANIDKCNAISRRYAESHVVEMKAYRKAYREMNIERLRANDRATYRRKADTIKAKKKSEYRENAEKLTARSMAYYKKNTGKVSLKKKDYYIKNAERFRIRSRAYYAAHKSDMIAYGKAYSSTPTGRAKARAASAVNKKKRSLRVPSWYERKEIERFYGNCPPGMQVDHIVPLLGKTVSGLHVLRNLQYLTKEENQRKRNNYDSTSVA